MENTHNKEVDVWKRPWMIEKFDNIYDRDERFFSILIKGLMSWLNRNIVLYNKGINHFIFNTGSTYMYIESNGYNISWNETTGEDQIYMKLPRCVLEVGNLSFPTEELSNPFSRGFYERITSDGKIKGYNAEIRRLPVEWDITLHYVLANFNESIVLLQELIDKILFQKYFYITYLGNKIECSIEFPNSESIDINKIDMNSVDTNKKQINLSIKLFTNYPIINERTEISSDITISKFSMNTNLENNEYISDKDKKEIE